MIDRCRDVEMLILIVTTSIIGCLESTARPEHPNGKMKLEQPELMLSYGVANGIALEIMA